jgi:hypothetical protein
MPFVRTDGRPYVSPPLARNRKEANAALRQAFAKLRGPPLQKMRVVRAGPDLRMPKRRLAARIREPRRPAIAHSRPTARRDSSSSAARLRAAPVQLVAIGGRDGNGERDDGSGSGDGNGNGGGGEPRGPSPHDPTGASS